jgi:hypothetical protein
VEEEEIGWLWEKRIPRGEVTILAGDPGLGKSTVTHAIAAKLSIGFPLPDGGEAIKGTSLFASYEESPEKVMRQRLRKLGADMSKVLLLDQLKDENGNPRRFRGSDVPTLDAALDMVSDPQMLVIDPVMSFMGDVDTNKDAQVRIHLQPLVDLAQRRNISIVCVAHLSKADAGKILYKISGSVGFAALARSVLLVGLDENSGRRGIAHIKSNLGPLVDTIEYSIDDRGFHWGRLAPELTAQSFVAQIDRRQTCSQRDIARDWLVEFLSEGPRWATDIREVSEQEGHSWRTLMRVKSDLGITHEKVDGKYRWTLVNGT